MTLRPRHFLVASAVIAGVLLFWSLGGNDPLSPEAGIDAALDAGVAALEAGDSGALMDLVSDDFEGEIGREGTFDRQRLGQYAGLYLLREGGVSVRIVTRDIEARGETEGTATIRAVGVRGGVGGALAGDVEADTFYLEFVLEDGDWKVRRVRR